MDLLATYPIETIKIYYGKFRVSTPKVHQNSRSFPGFLKVDLKFSRCKNYSYIEHCRSNIIQIRVLFVLML